MAEDRCAVLLHSSDRMEARPFWRPTLVTLDRHFPPGLCDLHFSYGTADVEVRAILNGLQQPFTLIRRGDGDQLLGWSGALLKDLERLTAYRWIFHLMDDAIIPDPISRFSISTVLDVARRRNASTIALYRRTLNFWHRMRGNHTQGAADHVSLPLALVDTAVVASAPGVYSALDFYRASIRKSALSSLVVQQNFALWRRDALAWTLREAGDQAGPHQWEARFSGFWQLHEWPGSSQALAVWYRGLDGMLGVEDIGHRGRIKEGFAACAWIRAATRVGLSPDSVPGGKEAASQSGSAFCYADGLHGLGRHFVTAVALLPGRCGWQWPCSQAAAAACTTSQASPVPLARAYPPCALALTPA